MKITMYELLGMIKDGKTPEKIKYMGYIFEYDINHKRYESYFDEQIWTLIDFVNVDDNLNDEVEILEEEKKIPEKLKIEQDTPSSNYYIRNENGTKCALTKHSKMITETLNQVIDYLKSKGDE